MPRKKKTPEPKVENTASTASVRNGLQEAVFGGNNFIDSPSGRGSQLSQLDTLYKNMRWTLISNQRQILSEIYVELGLIQTVIDVPVDDGLRGGIEIATKQLSPEQIQSLQTRIERENILGTYGEALKWTRLFGGGGVLIINGEKPTVPLTMDTVKKGMPLEFKSFDLWELYFNMQDIDEWRTAQIKGPLAAVSQEFYNYYGQNIHRSRVHKMVGFPAPSLVRPKMRGWGLSVTEIFIRSVNQYLKSTNLSFEVLDEFKLDVYKIKNLVNTLLTPDGDAAVRRRIALANAQKNYQNAVVMDAEDDFDHKQLSFSGIAETMQGIRLQIASDLRMPLTKLFGISAQGFNSGEDDIENYNSMVESQVRSKCKHHLLAMVELLCQQDFGVVPDDLTIEFKPLRILSAEIEENVKTQQFSRLLQSYQAGLISHETFIQACNKDSLLSIQVDASDASLIAEESEEGDEEDSSSTTGSPVKGAQSQLTAKEPKEPKS